jgi:hypothetical protein
MNPGLQADSVRRSLVAIAAAMLALLAAGCGESPQAPESSAGLLPAEPEARALHCYLVLTLTIEQLKEFEGTGPQAGYLSRQSSDELLRARRRAEEELDEGQLDALQRDPVAGLEALLTQFDADSDGQLSSKGEVEAFNRHVAACSRPRSTA